MRAFLAIDYHEDVSETVMETERASEASRSLKCITRRDDAVCRVTHESRGVRSPPRVDLLHHHPHRLVIRYSSSLAIRHHERPIGPSRPLRCMDIA